jgi:threonine/homoserine/homoserine lactone efflux protein
VLGGLGAFVAVSAVVICTPGQDTALTIRNTLGGGRLAGLATAGGVAIGNAIWTMAASVGVVAILSASEPVFHALKLAGGAYLAYLGVESLLAALGRRRHDTTRLPGSARLAPAGALRQGVLSNLGNPKIAVFFASLLPQFAPGGAGSFAALLALGFLFSSMTWARLTLYAVAVSRARRLLAGRARRVLDGLSGAILVALGVRLATEPR